eukprot:5836286-Alexandrium_andersonii.AAC.1
MLVRARARAPPPSGADILSPSFSQNWYEWDGAAWVLRPKALSLHSASAPSCSDDCAAARPGL